MSTIRNHKHEINKLEKSLEIDTVKIKQQIKIKMIENSMELIEEFFSATNRLKEVYLNIAINDLNILCNELKTINPVYSKKYYQADVEYKKQAKQSSKITSKFKLCGLKTSNEKLSSFAEHIRVINNQIRKSEKAFFDKNEFDEYKKEYEKLRQEFYEALYKDFENMK